MSRVGRHVLIAIAVGIAVSVLAVVLGYPVLAGSLGWDAAAIVFLVTTWAHLWPMDAPRTQASVTLEAPSSVLTETVVIVASVLSLASVILLLLNTASSGIHPAVRTVAAIGTVALGWLVVHTVFALRYARMYYGEPEGGIDFNMSGRPSYADFAYVSFGIGMSFQIADTNVSTTEIRRAVLKHALLSYLYATLILAVTVNLIANVNSQTAG